MPIAFSLFLAGSIDHENDRIGRQQNSEKNNAEVDSMPPLRLLWTPHPPVETPYADQNPDRKEWREEENIIIQAKVARWNKLTMFANWVAALATALAAYLVALTLVTTRGMLQEAETATKATTEMLVEAEKSTKAAERATDIQLESFRRLERPYLYILINDTRYLHSKSGSSFPYIEYSITNAGKTPAALRSASIGLYDFEDGLEFTTGAISAIEYHLIEPGARTHLETLRVTRGDGGHSLRHYEGHAATCLVLVAHFEYEDPTGAVHTDWIRLRCNTDGNGFRLDGPIRRATFYPSVGN